MHAIKLSISISVPLWPPLPRKRVYAHGTQMSTWAHTWTEMTCFCSSEWHCSQASYFQTWSLLIHRYTTTTCSPLNLFFVVVLGFELGTLCPPPHRSQSFKIFRWRRRGHWCLKYLGGGAHVARLVGARGRQQWALHSKITVTDLGSWVKSVILSPETPGAAVQAGTLSPCGDPFPGTGGGRSSRSPVRMFGAHSDFSLSC
jgi:hypothetical protein